MNTESLDDFKRNYRDCYVLLNTKNESLVAIFLDHSENDFIFKTLKYGELLIDEKSARDLIVLPFPPFGLYNIQNSAYLFQRSPNRQWKKAIHPDNCSLLRILSNIDNLNLDLHIVTELLNPQYPENLLEAINKKQKLIAVNQNIVLYKQNNKINLYWHRRLLGYLNPEKKQVILEDPVMEQEIKDYIKQKDKEWILVTKN